MSPSLRWWRRRRPAGLPLGKNSTIVPKPIVWRPAPPTRKGLSRRRARRRDAQEATVWIRELAELLGCEQRVAYQVLRITLHTVRDRLSVDDNAKVGNDLPLLLRGLYFEVWDPMKTHGPDDLRDLATLPLTAAADGDVFAKIMTWFETRRGHKKSTNLALALKLCATSAQNSDPPALFLRASQFVVTLLKGNRRGHAGH